LRSGTLEPNKSSLELLDTTSRPFTYRELSSFTKNFSDNELLSSGGFGDVFKGTLPSGAFVAVKRIKRNKMQGEESFLAEATSLGQIRHRNLLRLRGWCQAKEGLLLVYDFMCNGSLDQWIYRPPAEGLSGKNHQSVDIDPGLSWNRRLSILAGTASGLVYLHEEWQQCILHRDIKASNVLLDASFNAYLGDFGLARLVDHGVMQKTTLLAGTLGYMAPEMQYTGRASIETDVYAFGILVLEVVCGRRALGSVSIEDSTEHYVLVESVWQAHEAGQILRVADPRLWNHGDDDYDKSRDGLDETMVRKVLQLGLLCCLPSPGERPSMRFVSQWFQSGSRQELPWLPDRKASLNLPMPSRIDSSFGQDKLPSLGQDKRLRSFGQDKLPAGYEI